MTSPYDITCDFGRAMTETNLKANCAYFDSKKKKMLFRFFQHFKSLKTFSIEETREKNFRVICTLRPRITCEPVDLV